VKENLGTVEKDLETESKISILLLVDSYLL